MHRQPRHKRIVKRVIGQLFARAPGRTLTHDRILGRVRGPDHRGDPRTVGVHIRWLRDKIEPNSRHPERLVTVRGVGYRLDLPR